MFVLLDEVFGIRSLIHIVFRVTMLECMIPELRRAHLPLLGSKYTTMGLRSSCDLGGLALLPTSHVQSKVLSFVPPCFLVVLRRVRVSIPLQVQGSLACR